MAYRLAFSLRNSAFLEAKWTTLGWSGRYEYLGRVSLATMLKITDQLLVISWKYLGSSGEIQKLLAIKIAIIL